MMRYLSVRLRSFHSSFPTGLRGALIVSQVIALAWWLVALYVRSLNVIPIWYDQQAIFMRAAHNLANPYQTPGFVNPPWTAVLLTPFSLLPLEAATLIQAGLYFAILTKIIFKFGGGLQAVLIALVSFLALDVVLELNIDWLVCLGLIVPPAWGAPLLLVKPQNALGYYLGLRWKEWRQAAIGAAAVVVVSLIGWGNWVELMLTNVRTYVLGPINLAPRILLSLPVSVAIGVVLAYLAFRRRDAVLGIWAWLFFVPYITFYGLLLPYTLLAVRFPRAALIISGVIWVVYGRVLIMAISGG